ALYKKLEAAEKRIAELDKRLIEYAGIATREAHRVAELEARTVILPEPIIVLHRRDFTDAHREIYAYPEAEVNAALADAGIGVNGE
ncbi:ead/Ea22-like family protein, partial [Salmonella enterica]|nr:ead/Ea22-like family protein [Salmonella enterica]